MVSREKNNPMSAYLSDMQDLNLFTEDEEMKWSTITRDGLKEIIHTIKSMSPGIGIIRAIQTYIETKTEDGKCIPPAEKLISKVRKLISYDFESEEDRKVVERISKQFEKVEYAANMLVKANLRLVINIAKRYPVNEEMTLNDLIQEGNVGLFKASYRFNPDRGNKFSTYASWWIRQSISKGIKEQGRAIRWLAHVHEVYRTIKSYRNEKKKRLHEESPSQTYREIAEELNLNIQTATSVDYTRKQLYSLDAPINTFGGKDDCEASLYGCLHDEKPSLLQQTSNKQLANKLEAIIDMLPPRNAEILRLRFGIGQTHSHTLQEVGEIFDLSRERIRQIQENSLKKMRTPGKISQLKGFLNA